MKDNLNKIREIDFYDIKIGGETSFPILNPLYVLNIPVFDLSDNFEIAKSYFGTDSVEKVLKSANNSDCDIVGLKFNIQSVNDIDYAVENLKSFLSDITKPVMISGAGNDNIDSNLLPEIIRHLDRKVIINGANENTYKDIIPQVVCGGHIVVLKTPIDINLAKELNILSAELGLDLNKIIIDTDIGGLGYGLEYGYSIMEKIKLEGFRGDNYLNMPLISFACAESLKTKEAKTDLPESCWGNLSDRAKYFELASASAVKACGVNIIVMNYPPNISTMKGLVR
ncbi:MAG: hypothetical protein VZR09_03290 [Candidatus Gastranaerophilaceae bacterium]|nr:hypothetical protein [Candidatus Gastranaerophilaceae bacterium]